MNEKIFDIFEKKLEELKGKILYRSIRDVESTAKMKITFEGKEYLNFASNDYLGLTKHPLVVAAAKEALEIFGVGSGASRLLAGGTVFHRKLEEEICKFKGVESSLLMNSGYSANISLIPALTSEDDIILSDELNHASIIDGCRLSRAKKFIYRHRDIEEMERILKKNDCKGKKVLITDTVFSMDGTLAPLREIYQLCREHDALLYIDDAHGTGVLGQGYGALRHFGLQSESFVVQMGTLSKALGSFGAFVCGKDAIIRWFINSARGFIFSTSLPALLAASAYASLQIIKEDEGLLKTLWNNTEKVKGAVKKLGFKTTETETPIIPLLFESIEEAQRASEILKSFKIFAPIIRPPTVKIPRIRISVSAGHTEEDINRLLEALNHLYQQLRPT